MARLEIDMAIYWRSDVPYMPAANIRAVIETAARLTKDGPRVRRGLVVRAVEFASSDIAECTDRDQIVQKVRFQNVVKIGQRSIVRTRALFTEWSVTATIEVLDELVDAEALRGWLDTAGRLIGMGDWRPDKSGDHGRFVVGRFARA